MTTYPHPQYERPFTQKEVAKANKALQIEIMRHWFLERYEEPAANTPYDGDQYHYQSGGSFDAEEVLMYEFDGTAPEKVIYELVAQLVAVSYEWAGKQ
jgi:hypothetical protein